MGEANEERLVRLESAVAHLERLCEELNEVAVGQGKELERLRGQMQRVAVTVESQELDRIKSINVKPPHYQ